MQSFREFIAAQSQTPVQDKKWKASKEEIVSFWRNLRPDTPILMRPVNYQHKGSTYGEDGLRITGSPQFIGSVLSRLKEFLAFETPSTKLSLSYRETESPSKSMTGAVKTSYVFYVQSKQRGPNQSTPDSNFDVQP